MTPSQVISEASLRSGNRLCRPDRQLQHLAQGAQVLVTGPAVIRFPEIDALSTDTDLLGDCGH
jgi:hypothetical protein